MTLAQLFAAVKNSRLRRDVKGIAIYGDSGSGELYAALASLLPNARIENKGVGGATIEQIADKYIADVLWNGFYPVFHDLSGEPSPAGVALNAAGYPRLVSAVRRSDGEYLIVEPSVSGRLDGADPLLSYGISSANRWLYTTPRDALRADYGSRLVQIYEALQAANDGSPEDLADVAEGFIPRSLRGITGDHSDATHLNFNGALVQANLAIARMETFGWPVDDWV